jgi:hypothetical protein
MSRFKLIVPAALVTGGMLLFTAATYGKAEYTKETKKACNFCHVDAKKAPKELNAAGKYYHQHKKLDGYQETK